MAWRYIIERSLCLCQFETPRRMYPCWLELKYRTLIIKKNTSCSRFLSSPLEKEVLQRRKDPLHRTVRCTARTVHHAMDGHARMHTVCGCVQPSIARWMVRCVPHHAVHNREPAPLFPWLALLQFIGKERRFRFRWGPFH